jgi:hypothetical protein
MSKHEAAGVSLGRHHGSARIAVTLLALAGSLAACGGSTASSSTGATSGAAATATPAASTPTAAAFNAASCPDATTVGSALGVTLPAPTGVPSGVKLPTGATGVVCNYLSSSLDVLISMVSNISSSYVAQQEQAVTSRSATVKFTSVSGVGDQAVSYDYTFSGSFTAEGVLATKGSNFVAVSATRTPATLSQVEALVNQLLG